MEVKIHTQAIKGSGFAKEDEHPDALFRAVLEIDGHLVEPTGKIRVIHDADGIAHVSVRLFPGSIQTVGHTEESWKELFRRSEQ